MLTRISVFPTFRISLHCCRIVSTLLMQLVTSTSRFATELLSSMTRVSSAPILISVQFLVFVWWYHHTLHSRLLIQVLSLVNSCVRVGPWFCHCWRKCGSADSFGLFKMISHSAWSKAPLLCRCESPIARSLRVYCLHSALWRGYWDCVYIPSIIKITKWVMGSYLHCWNLFLISVWIRLCLSSTW